MYEWSFEEFLELSNRIRYQHDCVYIAEEQRKSEEALSKAQSMPQQSF